MGDKKLRKRTTHSKLDETMNSKEKLRDKVTECEFVKQEIKNDENKKTDIVPDRDNSNSILKGSYWLTRIVLIRYMGFIYFVAFLVSLLQNQQLIGKNGLLPVNLHLDQIKSHLSTSDSWTLLSALPTVLWFVNYSHQLDFWLDIIAWTGLVIATIMMITGGGNWPLLLTQWLLYHSLVGVGQRWFSFGWESQVLETGFLTIFLTPALTPSPTPRGTQASKIVIFAYRWLIFRIMLGAGLIKIRGDKCWRDLTCMNFHYETQPVPNPLSYFLHQSPEFIHKFEVLSNHFVELVAPWFLLLTRRWCMLGGFIQIFFQVVLIISGNLSFLNWLTILPSLACFDDLALSWMFSSHHSGVKARVKRLQIEAKSQKRSLSSTIRTVFNLSLGLLIAYLSIPVVQNLLSPRQAMNTSFDPLRLVNTYGAFGSITKKRTEVILQGTNSSDPTSPLAVWEEYQFNCKPGDLNRRPCLISPYHYRLDWLMWFAAFQSYQHNPWLIHLVAKLLVNDADAEALISHNPFHNKEPPKFVRAQHFRYRFTKIGTARSGAWWKRKLIGQYLQPVSLRMLSNIVAQQGWPRPQHVLKSQGS